MKRLETKEGTILAGPSWSKIQRKEWGDDGVRYLPPFTLHCNMVRRVPLAILCGKPKWVTVWERVIPCRFDDIWHVLSYDSEARKELSGIIEEVERAKEDPDDDWEYGKAEAIEFEISHGEGWHETFHDDGFFYFDELLVHLFMG